MRMNGMNGLAGRLLAGTALMAMTAGAAHAQSQRIIEDEIVVTSQRQEQSVLDVPIAVSAFSTNDLESRQIEGFQDIQFNIPNFSFSRSNFTGSSISLRGIGALAVASSSEPAVSVHINDVFIAAPRLFETEFYDVERLEILRGPQGTLFGRNATGGVLNVITAKADPSELTAYADVEAGNFGSVEVRGALNVPVTDTFAVRVAGTAIRRDGYTENEFTGNDIDDRDLWSVRGTARWLPTENTTIDVTASYFSENDRRQRASGSSLCNTDPVLGCGPGPLSFGGTGPDLRGTTFALSSTEALTLVGLSSGLPDALAALNAEVFGLFSLADGPIVSDTRQSSDPRVVALDLDPKNDAEETVFLFNARHDFENFTLKVNGGWGNSKIDQLQDFDGNQGTEINLSPFFATGIPANAAFPGSPGVAGVPILANTMFAGGTFPVSGFDIDNLAGSIAGRDLVRSNTSQSAGLSFGETTYYTAEVVGSSNFDGPFNFLLGANYIKSKGEADLFVTSNSLDYFAAAAAVTAARGGTYQAVLAQTGNEQAAIAAMNQVDGIVGYTPFFFNDSEDTFTRSISVFGEAYIDVTDKLKLTGGIRHNWDTKGVRDRGNFLESFQAGVPVPFVPVGTQNLRPLLDADEETEGTPGAANDYRVVEDDFNSTTGRGVIQYAWSEGVNLYASYTRGFKAGGFNPRASEEFAGGIPLTYGPETINAYEAGIKSVLFEGMLRANLTGFYYDYAGLQVANLRNQTSVNENVDATVWGLEGEFIIRPMQDLVFNVNASYLNTEIGDFATVREGDPAAGTNATVLADITNASNCVLERNGAPFDLIGFDLGTINPALAAVNPFIATPYTVCDTLESLVEDNANGILPASLNTLLGTNFNVTQTGLVQDVTGNQLPGSPEYSFSVGGQYTFHLPQGYLLTPRADVYHQGLAYATIFNDPRDELPSYTIANAQITLEPGEGNWYIRGFIQNLTDEDALTGLSPGVQTSGLFTQPFLVEPRRYGVGAGIRF